MDTPKTDESGEITFNLSIVLADLILKEVLGEDELKEKIKTALSEYWEISFADVISRVLDYYYNNQHG